MISEAVRLFLAYSTELEQEARERYTELAENLAMHNNHEVAAFFERMADEARDHLADVTLLTEGEALPALKAWEFDWPEAEPPETASYEAVHYRMSLREALLLALANEHAAAGFYRAYGARSEDSRVRQLAAEFADEESSHAQVLEAMLENLPEVSAVQREEDDPPVIPE